MFLTRWRQPVANVFGEMNQLRREMDRVWDQYARGTGSQVVQTYPPVNVWEDENCVYAESELPGMKMDDLEIYVTGRNQLTIKGTRKPPEPGKGTWHRQERGYGTFGRVLTLPTDVDQDKVEAEFKSGILTIKLPKGEEAKPRRINVKTG